MDTNRQDARINDLICRYTDAFSNGNVQPIWAVHKKRSPNELIIPTIPFVGRQYFQQKIKILIYASAENLSGYLAGSPWPIDLDENSIAINRHRNCFDDKELQKGRSLPYVHCSPMQDGGLLTASMYLAYRLTGQIAKTPQEFYETIAFGNYGKYSIETEKQQKQRLGMLGKAQANNIDYASNQKYLEASRAFIQADLEVLQPDYIIMHNMNDHGFINSIKGKAEIIQIHQMGGRVINNMGENGRSNPQNRYCPRDIQTLPASIQNAYNGIQRISQEKYKYVFDYLDHVLVKHLEMSGN